MMSGPTHNIRGQKMAHKSILTNHSAAFTTTQLAIFVELSNSSHTAGLTIGAPRVRIKALGGWESFSVNALVGNLLPRFNG